MSWNNKVIEIVLIFSGLLTFATSYIFSNLALLIFSVGLIYFYISSLSAIFSKINIIVLLLLGSVIFTELITPAFLPQGTSQRAKEKTHYDLHSGYAKEYFVKTELGSQAVEGIHTSRKLSLDDETIYSVKYSIGMDGFRITPSNNDSNPRINIFGGSFTFGEGLEDNETLPYYLVRDIDGISVKNFGFHGYGAHHALAILESDRDMTGTINVFLTIPWHADRSACRPKYSVGSPKYRITAEGEAERVGSCTEYRGPLGEVVRNSNLYALVQMIQGVRNRNHDIELYLSLVGRMENISKANNQKFIVGFIKAEDERYFFGSNYTNDIIFSELAKRSDAIVDLSLADQNGDMDKKYSIPLDGHPTAIANKERAVLLEKSIRSFLQ